jgi:hypothetical protein
MSVEVRDLVIAGDVGAVRGRLDSGGDVDQTDPATNQTLLMSARLTGCGPGPPHGFRAGQRLTGGPGR